MTERAYTVHLQREPEGGYTVTAPALPGLVTYGKTYREALSMAREAIGCYLASLEADGEEPPADPEVAQEEFVSRVVLDDPVTV